jgi:dTDP-4-amino-4,6-dideoxygalactose transaminase
MNHKKIWLSSPHMGEAEMEFVKEAFDTNWVAPVGPHLDAFEKDLCVYNDTPCCAALSSGTAAIHLALIMLGIKTGDEVICSTFTFSGSCNPILYQHATPVFIDSEAKSWNMNAHLLDEAIKDRMKKGIKPKAIIAVHLYGMPARMVDIMAVARAYGIPVIEDAAEALGASYEGRKCGTFGDIGIYSFNGNKIITTSGGGAMVSGNPEWIQQAKFLSTQARDRAPHYEHSKVGYNYRLSNISAAIGRGQMKVLDERVGQRRAVFEFYKKELQQIPGVIFQPELNGSFSNRWLTCIVLDKELHKTPEDVRLALEKENIESRPLWKPMHMQPVFKGAPYYGNGVSEDLFQRGLCLPSGSNLTQEDLSRVVTVIKEVLNA